jgi:hypothetical protein
LESQKKILTKKELLKFLEVIDFRDIAEKEANNFYMTSEEYIANFKKISIFNIDEKSKNILEKNKDEIISFIKKQEEIVDVIVEILYEKGDLYALSKEGENEAIQKVFPSREEYASFLFDKLKMAESESEMLEKFNLKGDNGEEFVSGLINVAYGIAGEKMKEINKKITNAMIEKKLNEIYGSK